MHSSNNEYLPLPQVIVTEATARDVVELCEEIDQAFELHPLISPECPDQASQPLLAKNEEYDTETTKTKLLIEESSSAALEDTRFGSIALLEPWFPNVNPEHHTWRTRRSRRKTMLWIAFINAFSIFVVNLSFTLFTWLRYESPFDGVVTLYQGDCGLSKQITLSVHLVLNILSTLLLGASNLCIQLLVAPTRTEVDGAHSKGKWLDIGVPSWRNFCNLSLLNKAACVLLALSSIPVHFLYNSAIFSTVSTNSYIFALVTEAFFLPNSTQHYFFLDNGTSVLAPTDISGALQAVVKFSNNTHPFGYWAWGGYATPEMAQTMVQIHDDMQANLSSYQNLSNIECLQAYIGPFQWRPHILLVSEDYETAITHNASLLSWGSGHSVHNDFGSLDPMRWTNDLSNEWEDFSKIDAQLMEEWSDVGSRVKYCLRKQNDPREEIFDQCRVQCAPDVLLIITIFNVVKCCGILWVFFGRPQHTLCTLGDAIGSFLERPDLYTRDCGVVSHETVQECSKTGKLSYKRQADVWRPRDDKLFRAASPRRWFFTLFTSCITLCGGVVVLGTGLAIIKKYEHSTSFDTLSSLGFGSTNYREIITWNQPYAGKWGLFANILIANVWQVLVSLCYAAQNALLSCILVVEEWAGFATDRKTLRVSHPRGIQRSTYFISMPLRYAIPIMTLFIIEHWLLSLSTFIVRVVNFDTRELPMQEVIGWTTSGFSILPAILAAILPVILIIAQITNAFRRIPGDAAMPLVSTCSLAISASCHRPDADSEAHLLPVQWGVTERDGTLVQRCSFTTLRTVSPPLPGSQIQTIGHK